MISRASDRNLNPRPLRSNRFAGSGGIDAGDEAPSGKTVERAHVMAYRAPSIYLAVGRHCLPVTAA